MRTTGQRMRMVSVFLTALLALATGAQAGTWSYAAWTGDADSGIDSASDYTVAVNCGGGAVTVNAVSFEASTLSGPNFLIGGSDETASRDPNISGNSKDLASVFIHGSNPRTVTLYHLTPGVTYETTFFSYAWEGSGRVLIFASGGDSLDVDQDFYGMDPDNGGNGIRVSYAFEAASDSQSFSISNHPRNGQGPFHMSALANRIVQIGPLDHFEVSAPSPQMAGVPFSVTVTAKDAGDRRITTYAGTIHFTSSDGAATLPGDYEFVSGDNGSHAFAGGVTLNTVGAQYITASGDGKDGTSSSITVNPAPGPLHHFEVTATSPQTAGSAFSVTVTAKDADGITVTTDSSTVVTMTSSGSAQFDSNGDGTFGDIAKTLSSGMFTINAMDAVAESVTLTATAGDKNGTSSLITVILPLRISISVFNSSTTWVAPSNGAIQLLVVGGGGGGADGYGGGGGGGGVSYGTFAVTRSTVYTVTVGDGGAHGWGLSPANGGGPNDPQPRAGGTSSFIGGAVSLSASGGAGAVDSRQSTGAASGSGTWNGTFVPGYAGGDGFTQLGGINNSPPDTGTSIPFMAGGGGGAGGAGYAGILTGDWWDQNSWTAVQRADGGDGVLLSSILGGVFSGGTGETFVAEALAGGGGGGGGGIYPGHIYASLIGTNAYGGGSGATDGGADATAGLANTGGGGGGGQYNGANGGSGVVALSFRATFTGIVLLIR